MIRSFHGVATRAAAALFVVGAAAISVAVAPTETAAAAPRSVHEIHEASQAPGVVRAAGRSLNWSGYVKPGSGFTSVAGSFRMPTLATTYPGYSSMWVGLDGASASDGYLIQTGIEADVVGGKASYYAWWELITPTNPAPEVRFTTVAIRPGDVITERVAKTSATLWTMSVTNVTTKQTASHSAAFAGRGLSAEWIVEDTDVNGFISTAPDWNQVGFSAATVNNVNPQLAASQAIDIWSAPGLLGGALGQGPIHEDTTTAPTSARNQFTVTWLATGRRSRA